MIPINKWERKIPEHTGWYWLTIDPTKQPLGVFMYIENCDNYISEIIEWQPDNYYISGPVLEPKNDPI